jgi:hypothetical protein
MPFKYDFKEIAETTDIFAVAKYLKLAVVKNRAYCPACDTDRAIELKPETNTFICFAGTPREPEHKNLAGDCINLVVHIRGYESGYPAARELKEHFGTAEAARTAPSTSPQAERRETTRPTSKGKRGEAPFDAIGFGKKLTYTDEVKAAGFTQAVAERFGIGFRLGYVYIPVRDETGFLAGFLGYKSGDLKQPPSWLPSPVNVVAFPKRA